MRTSALERPEAPLAKALFSHRTTRIPRAASAQAMLVPARGGSDPHATSPERAHDVERSGNQLGILGQTVELQRDEVGNIRSTSFSPGGRPCAAVHRALTPSSAMQPKSMVVPAQSRSAARIGPR